MDVLKFNSVINKVVSDFRQIKGPREDLVQECYLALLESDWPENIKDEDKLAESICRTKLNLLQRRDNLNSKGSLVDSLDDPRVFNKAIRIPENQGLTTERQLNDAVCDLPYNEYQVVHGIFYEGQTEEKTASDLSISRTTVQRRKQRGIDKLKQHFEVE